MRSGVGWDVTRIGGSVRISIDGRFYIPEDASTAIVAATMEHLLDEHVSIVQLDGSALGPDLLKGLAEAVTELELLAERYGKEFMVVPI